MFVNCVSSIPKFTEDPWKISVTEKLGPVKDIWGDVCFYAAMGAIVVPRLKEDEKFTIHDCSENAVTKESFVEVLNDRRNACIISAWSDKAIADIDKSLEKCERLVNCEKAIKSRFEKANRVVNSRLYVNRDNNTFGIILPEFQSFGIIHLLSGFITKYLPNIAPIDSLTDLEKKLVMNFGNKDGYNTVMQCFEDIAKDRFMGSMTVTILNKFKHMVAEKELAGYEEKARRARLEAERIYNEYKQRANALHDALLAYAGAKALKDNAKGFEGTALDFITSIADKIEIVSAEDKTLTIIIDGLVTEVDCDSYEDWKEDRGFFKTESPYGREDQKILFDDLFSETPTFSVRTCGVYNLNMTGYCTSNRHYDYGEARKDRIPNPHLQIFACLGDWSTTIDDALLKGDLVGAIKACIGSLSSVDIGETDQTFKPFLKNILNSTTAILEDNETHEQYTVQEALKRLKGTKE